MALEQLANAYAAEESQTATTTFNISDEDTIITPECEDTLIIREDSYGDQLIKKKTLRLLDYEQDSYDVVDDKTTHNYNITAFDNHITVIDDDDIDMDLIEWLKNNDLIDIKDVLIAKKYRLLTFKYLNTDDLNAVVDDLKTQLTVPQILRFKSAVNKLSIISSETNLATADNDDNKQNIETESHSTTQTITIIGGSRVGKSSIADVIIGHNFNAKRFPTIRMTEKAQIFSKDIGNNITVKYRVWDCPGQKALEHIPPLYITGALAILIVYDITDNVTYERAKEWMVYVRDEGKGYNKVLVVGNKKDLMDERVVYYEEANNYCMQFGYNYIETSAKSGINMDTLQEWLDSHTQRKVENQMTEWQDERIYLEHNVDQLKKESEWSCCDF